MVSCDLCGKSGQLYQARVEGSLMTVCESCAKYGEVVKRIPSAKEVELSKKAKAKEQEEVAAKASLAPKGEVLLLVRPDYARVIKAAREKLGLKQEEMAKRLNIRESQLHKYETGSHAPDLETARVLEKGLKIKLVYEYTEKGEGGAPQRDSAGFTLGDFVKRR